MLSHNSSNISIREFFSGFIFYLLVSIFWNEERKIPVKGLILRWVHTDFLNFTACPGSVFLWTKEFAPCCIINYESCGIINAKITKGSKSRPKFPSIVLVSNLDRWLNRSCQVLCCRSSFFFFFFIYLF